MIRRPPRSTLFPYTSSSDLYLPPLLIQGLQPLDHGAVAQFQALRPAGLLCRLNRKARNSRSRSEEHTSELQSPDHIVCRLLLEKKKATYMLIHEPYRYADVL